MPHYEDNPSPLAGPIRLHRVQDADEAAHDATARALRVIEEVAREVRQGRHEHQDTIGVLRVVYGRVRDGV